MELTTNSDRSDVSARLDRLERLMGRLVDAIEQSTVVARAERLAGDTPAVGSVGERLSMALIEITEPDVLAALTRIATLAPQLEAAAHAAAAAPDLLEEALGVVREKLGDDGPRRMQALIAAASALAKPEVITALGQVGSLAPAVQGPLTVAASTVAEVRGVVGDGVVDDNVRELTRTLLDPDVTQSLTRIAGLAPQLEYAAFAAASLPEVLEEALQFVRSKTARFHDGVTVEARIDAVAEVGMRVSKPEVLGLAVDTLMALMPLGERLAKLPETSLASFLRLIDQFAKPATFDAFTRLLDHLPGLSRALLALPTSDRTLAFLTGTSAAIERVAARGNPAPLGLFGALRALRDPKVQAVVGFAAAVAHEVGEELDKPGELPPAR